MANIKQQKKRILTNEKARVRNVSYKSKLRTAMKKVRVACKAGDAAAAADALKVAFSVIDRAVVKGIEKKETGARQKSNLQKLVNGLGK